MSVGDTVKFGGCCNLLHCDLRLFVVGVLNPKREREKNNVWLLQIQKKVYNSVTVSFLALED